MSLTQVISRWTGVDREKHNADPWATESVGPIERRERFTLRRLYDLLKADAHSSPQQKELSDASEPPHTVCKAQAVPPMGGTS